jgi:catechol 2,3-dioxygenase-like lactoylglutathione lyase family enzyme
MDSHRSKWIHQLSHLAIVVDDVAKARWFYETVLGCEVQVWRETQLLIHLGESLIVAKLSKDAVDATRQSGSLEKQVLDHFGFMAKSSSQVDAFAARLKEFGLEIVKGPYDRADGRAVYFRDPFGNLVEYLYYNP